MTVSGYYYVSGGTICFALPAYSCQRVAGNRDVRINKQTW